MQIQDKIRALQNKMQEKKMDYYMIPTADYHASEYVSDFFQVRKFFSGFTGSNGTLLVWKEGAGLWTDGRYFIQAEKELAGSGITLFKMLTEGTPTIKEFLEKEMKEGQVLGFDGRVISAKQGEELERVLQKKNCSMECAYDLAESIWLDRPAMPCEKVFTLPEDIVGKTVTEKLSEVRESIQKEGAEAFFLSKLDDIMWLFNIRGKDVECNPVALSYAFITLEEAFLFLQQEALTDEVETYLKSYNVTVKGYSEIGAFLSQLATGKVILADPSYVCLTHMKSMEKSSRVLRKKNPTEGLKAIKNQTELEQMRRFFLLDSIVVTKFIYWLKSNIGKKEITEVSAAEYLDNLRAQIPGFLELSFPTIAGFGANAAMMHYEATPENHAVLEKKGMLLVDSGGQYLGATTDVTRTIVLGELTEEERRNYTLTAMGMLAMTNAIFLEGCTGRNLDILARGPLWKLGIDYLCGTGHGVGYILNVHEGPHGIRWKYNPAVEEAVLKPGMVVTNEPGVYLEGKHGIRIENVLEVRKSVHNEYGQFLSFQTLTWVPLDPAAMDLRVMSEESRNQYQEYQRQVYEKVSPYLSQEERLWLYKECARIE